MDVGFSGLHGRIFLNLDGGGNDDVWVVVGGADRFPRGVMVSLQSLQSEYVLGGFTALAGKSPPKAIVHSF